MAALKHLTVRAKWENEGEPLTAGNRSYLISAAAHHLLREREDGKQAQELYGRKPRCAFKMVKRSSATVPGALAEQFISSAITERFERDDQFATAGQNLKIEMLRRESQRDPRFVSSRPIRRFPCTQQHARGAEPSCTRLRTAGFALSLGSRLSFPLPRPDALPFHAHLLLAREPRPVPSSRQIAFANLRPLAATRKRGYLIAARATAVLP